MKKCLWVLKKLWGHEKLISTLIDNIKAFQWTPAGTAQKGRSHSCSCPQLLLGDTDIDGREVLYHLRSEKSHDLLLKTWIRTPLLPISGSMRRHLAFAKIHSHVCLRKSLQTCSLSSSTCGKHRGPEQHIVTRISTKDFPPPHSLHFTSVLSEQRLTFITMAINKSKQRSRMIDAHLHAVLCISRTEMEPDIREIVAKQKQPYKSHCNF